MTSDYSYSENQNEFTRQARLQLDKGLALTDIEYADDTFFGTYNDKLEGSLYLNNADSAKAAGQIREQLNAGLDLVDLEYFNKTWYSTFIDNPGTSYFFAEADLGDFDEQLQQQLNRG